MRRWSQLVHPFSLKLDNLFSGPIPRCSLQTSIIYCIQTSSQILLETKSTTSSKITENAPKKPLNIVKDFEGRKTTSQFTQTKFYHYRLFSYTPQKNLNSKLKNLTLSNILIFSSYPQLQGKRPNYHIKLIPAWNAPRQTMQLERY